MTNTTSSVPRYATFYLVMLILTSIGIGISVLASFTAIPEVVRTFSFAQAYGVIQAVGVAATIISLPALILLWMKKNPVAINLLLGTYAVIILVSLASLFFLEPVVHDASIQAAKDSPDIPTETLNALTSFGIYTMCVLQLIVNVVMAILWWFAYRSQRHFDEENTPSPKTK
jgi:hypothetical protein